VTFHGLTFGQLLHALACRSETRGLSAEFGRAANRKLYSGVGASLFLQGMAQLFPATRRLLGLTPLGAGDLLRIGAIAIGSSVANDLAGRIAAQSLQEGDNGARHVA
jgi:Ca2+-transporting ATPase